MHVDMVMDCSNQSILKITFYILKAIARSGVINLKPLCKPVASFLFNQDTQRR